MITVHLQNHLPEIHARALGTIYSLGTANTLYAPMTGLIKAAFHGLSVGLSVAFYHVNMTAMARHMTWYFETASARKRRGTCA
jgi:hypothetical protein